MSDRRKRFAFAVAPRWKGASIDAAEAPLRSANPDKARACGFSSTILAHSVGEHLSCASIQLLRAIVSNEENIISVIIAGNRTAWNTCDSLRERRLVFFIKKRLDPDSFRKSPPERSGIDYPLSKVWSVIERGVFLARYSLPDTNILALRLLARDEAIHKTFITESLGLLRGGSEDSIRSTFTAFSAGKLSSVLLITRANLILDLAGNLKLKGSE